MPNPVNIIGLLGKVKFIFYGNEDLPGIGIPYQPVYNPTEFSVSYTNAYDEGKQANSGDSTKKFVSFSPRTLSMELFLMEPVLHHLMVAWLTWLD